MSVVIIDNYDSFTFNLYQLVQPLINAPVLVVRNDAIDFAGLAALNPSHIILSPGPGHPAVAADFGIGAEIIKRNRELNCPILGVCLGHQGIVHYLGGKVERAPHIVHGKKSVIRLEGASALFRGVSDGFSAMRYHSLIADEKTLPSCLNVTARESERGLVMAVEHKEWLVFGVQFHPESIGTSVGPQIMENFLMTSKQARCAEPAERHNAPCAAAR